MQSYFETIIVEAEVNPDDIVHLMDERLSKYNDKNFIEKYALYMGMAQILELQMKQILYRDFGYSSKRKLRELERKTFGQSILIFIEKGVRPDLIHILEKNKDNRNNMAHSFLTDTMISTSIGFSGESIEVRQLDKYILELENLIIFWEQCIKHNALMPIVD